jgi:hypothetical protein
MSALVPAHVYGRQQPGPVAARIGVRSYLFPDVFDNLTQLHVTGRNLPGPLGLRTMGLYAVEEIPGYTQRIQVQPGHDSILVQTTHRNRTVQRPARMSVESYLEQLRVEQSRRLLLAGFKASLATEEERRSLLEFEIPISVPRGLSSVVGEGGAGLRLSGNRNIRFSGRSEWTEGAVSTATVYNSKFPTLNMEQESQFRIEGNIGTKLVIGVEQDTRALTDLENRINVTYTGEEDEVIQEVIAGNTDFSLPGSQLLGFNQGARGLFGIRGTAQLGGLTFTALASQEKGSGEKATFRAGAQESRIRRPDISPLLGTYYFMDLSYRSRFSQRIAVLADSIVSVNVFVDDQQYENDAEKAAVLGAKAYFDPDNPSPLDTREAHEGSFHELNPEEFYLNRALGVLALNVSLGPKDVLGVTYTTAGGQTVGRPLSPAEPDSNLILKLIKPENPRPDDPTWNYELRNVYYLGSRNIPREGFQVKIYFDTPSGEDEYTQAGTDYLQILGLDQWGEVPGTPSDGKIDLNENYLNLARGELIFPDLEPFKNTSLNHTIEMYNTIDLAELRGVSRYYLEINVKSRRASFTLPAQNILDNSEVVTLNGRRLRRGADYQLNYLTGELLFLTDEVLDPSANVQVDYEYSPLIQLEQKTLLGARAEYSLGSVGAISGTVLSRSERTLDQRVRLGREPSRAVLYDATAMLNFEPGWMTRAVDALPLVRTEAPSRFNIEAEVAHSVPDPNTTGEALVDDFESAKNETGFGVGRGRWSVAATPSGRTPDERTRMLWFNPYERVASRDIYPAKETNIQSDRINVLTLLMAPNRPSPWPAGAFQWDSTAVDQRWNGIQQAVGAGAADLSKSQYLELWVRGDRGELHIDLGSISEDVDGSGELDTEDLLTNGIRNGIVDQGEDVGLNGLTDLQELDYYIAHAGENPQDYPTEDAKRTRYQQLYSHPQWYVDRSPDDPALDNWRYSNPNIYDRVNGTEGSQLDPDRLGHPDTEDINRNGYLDRANNYQSYFLNLSPGSADSIYVEGGDVDPATWGETDSWRLYRIPLTDVAQTVGTPDLSLVESIRLWVTGAPDSTIFRISVASIQVVGNLWREVPVESGGVVLPPETVRVSIRNTFENAEIYEPPPGVKLVRDRVTNLTQQEQSLALTFQQLPPGVEGVAFRNLSRAEDLTQYRELRMFLNGQPAGSWIANPDSSHMEAFIRFGADDNNFYEYRSKVHPGWDDRNHIEVQFDQITALKVELLNRWGASTGVPDTLVGNYRVRGRPSLSNIRKIIVGVRNAHPSLPIDGEVWLDELQVLDVRRDRGTAARVGMRAELADFSTVDFRYDHRTADFHGLREKRGSLSTTTASNLSIRTNLEKITPTRWGLVMPLAMNFRSNLRLPKYLPGSDLILADADRHDQRTSQEEQSITWSLRKGAPGESRVTQWTLDRMTFNFSASRRDGTSPVTPINESFQVQGQFMYDLNPRTTAELHPLRLLFFLPKSLRDTPFNPVPNQLNYSIAAIQSGDRSADKSLLVKSRYAFTATETYTLGMQPFVPVRTTYTLSLNRDLTEDWKLGDTNLGKEIGRRQTFDTSWEPGTFSWLTQRYQYRTEYRENNDPRFKTRVVGTGEGADQVQLGRDATSNATASANYAFVPGRVVGSPTPQTDLGGWPKVRNDLKKLMGRFTPVILNFSQDRTANQYNLAGRPSLSYQLGFRERPDVPQAAAAATQQSLIRTTKRITLTSGYDLPLAAALDISPRWMWVDNLSESHTTFTQSITWPSATLRWSGLQSLWIFPSVTRALNLTSSYNRTNDMVDRLSDFDGGARQRFNTRKTSAWQPFVSIQATLNNGIGISLSRNRTLSIIEQFSQSGSISQSLMSDFRLNLSYGFSAPQGIKIPFFSKPFKFNSMLDMSIDFVRTERLTEVKVKHAVGIAPGFVPTLSTSTWSVRPSMRYNFSRMIQGGLDVLFENVNDRLMDRNRKVREVAIFMNLFFS